MASGSFNPIGFLARIDGELLEAFAIKHDIPFVHDPKKKAEDEAKQFYTLFESIENADAHEAVWSAICDIDDMSTKQGWECLLETAQDDDVRISEEQIDKLTTNQSKAVFFYLNHKSIFEDALEETRLDNLSGWSSFPIVPRKKEDIFSRIQLFQSAIQEYYQKEYKGKHCKIVTTDREDRIFVVAFIEDTYKSEMAFSGSKLHQHKPKKPVFESFFVFRHNTGVLDIKAKGGKEKRHDLQEIFSEYLLDNPQIFDKPIIAYDFNMFRDLDSITFPVEISDRIDLVQLKAMRLNHKENLHQHTIQIGAGYAEHGTGNMKKALGGIAAGLNQYTVSQVTITVHFKVSRKTNRKSKATFQLTYPNRHNLKERDQDIKIRELLKRWKIDLL